MKSITVTVGACLLFIMSSAWLSNATAAGKGGAGGGAQGSSPSTGSQSASPTSAGASQSNAPFEATMLAYGAVDQAMHAIATRICSYAAEKKDVKPLVVIADQATMGNYLAYDAFAKSTALLAKSFNTTVKTFPIDSKAEKAEKTEKTEKSLAAVNSANFSAVFGTVAASTSDSSSSITILDPSAELKLFSFLIATGAKAPCTKPLDVVYAGTYSTAKSLETVEKALASLDQAHASLIAIHVSAPEKCAANSPCAVVIAGLDGTYNNFLQNLWSTNTSTGQTLMAQILQGYEIASAFESVKDRPVYLVYVNIAAAKVARFSC